LRYEHEHFESSNSSFELQAQTGKPMRRSSRIYMDWDNDLVVARTAGYWPSWPCPPLTHQTPVPQQSVPGSDATRTDPSRDVGLGLRHRA
jgi:hypothetical protein